ncbi:MAG: hypothetical protein IKS49_00890 [Actinomycetaceae bacterium]|nr:hypothetical protein [Actinomycetaceae bacterium]
MMKKKILAAAALAGAGALLAGCGSSASVMSIDPESTLAIIELANIDMSSVDDVSEEYKLLVVSQDGSTQVVEAKDKGAFLIDWAEDSLFIADSQSDTWLQAGKEPLVHDDPRDMSRAFSIVGLDDKGSVLISSHEGEGDEVAYSVVNKEGVEKATSKEFIYSFGTCGEATYGLSVNEDYMNQNIDDADFESMSEEEIEKEFSSVTYDSRAEMNLFAVVKGGKVDISRVGQHSAIMDGVMLLGPSLACEGEELVGLVLQNEVDGGLYNRTKETGESVDFNVEDYKIGSDEWGYNVLTLERWNVNTGERTVVPVTGEDGKPFVKAPQLVMSASMGASSVHDGTLYWVDALGRLVATDVQTGKSKALSDSLQTSSNMDELGQIFASFHEGNVSVLVHSDADPSKDRIVSLEIPSGKEIVSVDVPNLGGLVEAIDMNDENAMSSMTSMTSISALYANPHPKG